MIDPRSSVITKRFATINRVIAVSSGKGGVGKSMIATTIALKLAKKGLKVGLFDLDFTSPSTHLIMGVKNIQPKVQPSNKKKSKKDKGADLKIRKERPVYKNPIRRFIAWLNCEYDQYV